MLFGEWLWARHSVAYTKLPAYFVAFDIYNKRTGQTWISGNCLRRVHFKGRYSFEGARVFSVFFFGGGDVFLSSLGGIKSCFLIFGGRRPVGLIKGKGLS